MLGCTSLMALWVQLAFIFCCTKHHCHQLSWARHISQTKTAEICRRYWARCFCSCTGHIQWRAKKAECVKGLWRFVKLTIINDFKLFLTLFFVFVLCYSKDNISYPKTAVRKKKRVALHVYLCIHLIYITFCLNFLIDVGKWLNVRVCVIKNKMP